MEQLDGHGRRLLSDVLRAGIRQGEAEAVHLDDRPLRLDPNHVGLVVQSSVAVDRFPLGLFGLSLNDRMRLLQWLVVAAWILLKSLLLLNPVLEGFESVNVPLLQDGPKQLLVLMDQ